jgi:hypothetical protein
LGWIVDANGADIDLINIWVDTQFGAMRRRRSSLAELIRRQQGEAVAGRGRGEREISSVEWGRVGSGAV